VRALSLTPESCRPLQENYHIFPQGHFGGSKGRRSCERQEVDGTSVPSTPPAIRAFRSDDATRSRAPNGPPKARHEAGYHSRICLNKCRNTNLARETRTLCPVGRTALSPWV
jgi:hypothetical protein